jgi:NAD(P)-dependent dehydrogenase (short-subunit alcohol dehydrogenase family)
MSGVQNKKVLITGTSRGIGLAIAKEFLNQGAQVYGTATTKAAPQEFSGFCAADFSKREGIQQCVDFVNESSTRHRYQQCRNQCTFFVREY